MRQPGLTSSTVFSKVQQRKAQPTILSKSQPFSIVNEYALPHTLFASEAVATFHRKISQRESSTNYSPQNKLKTLFHLQPSNNSIETKSRSPNKVTVQFDIERKRKSQVLPSQFNTSTSYHQCGQFIAQSFRKYIGRVNLAKQKKLMKCNKSTLFGLDVKQIKYDCSLQRSVKAKTTQDLKSIMNIKLTHKRIIKCKTDNQDTPNSAIAPSNRRNKYQIRPRYSFKGGQRSKLQQHNSIESRFTRMIQFFSLVLYSYYCYLNAQKLMELSFQKAKRGTKYTYFIGSGNNGNLIRSLMKKRWWWIETNDIQSANFVWTQLRVDNLGGKDKLNSNPNSLPIKQKITGPPNLEVQKLVKKFHQPFRSKDINKLFHKDFKHVRKFPNLNEMDLAQLKQIKTETHFHNHYSANYMLGNKKALYNNLKVYCKYKGIELFDIVPLTIHIQNGESPAWNQFQQLAAKDKMGLWIVKPGENSNRGQGIFISDCPIKIKGKLKRQKPGHTFIIQKYIKNPFLFQKRKFDIRAYMLLVTIGGQMKFYWYSEGYLRTCSETYDNYNFYDPFIHLTNDAIQNRGSNYGKFERGNKISFHQFQRHLENVYPKQGYSVSKLVGKMKQMASKTVQATYNKIDPGEKEVGFELFGLDFLIDSSFKPWLIEVNTNPCLELSSPCLERLIPWLLENAFRISVDPLFPPCCQCPRSWANYIPDYLLQRNRFQLIFDSQFDRDPGWEGTCEGISDPSVYEEENQEYENEGDIIKVSII